MPFSKMQQIGRILNEIAIVGIFVTLFIIYSNAISGDAGIYFAFFKNFFELPFSHYDNSVSFGFTSPLFVMLISPIHVIFENSWIYAAQITNFLLLYFSAHYLSQASGGAWWQKSLFVCLIAINFPLLNSAGELFETSLSFLFISVLICLLIRQKWAPALFLAGSLHLVRPELVVLTIVTHLYILHESANKVRVIALVVLSTIPPLAFYAYMYVWTESIVPNSLLARLLQSNEDPLSWYQKATISYDSLTVGHRGIVYHIAAFTIFIALIDAAIRKHKITIVFLVFTLLLFIPYLIFPPKSYSPRYLLILLPTSYFLFVQILSGIIVDSEKKSQILAVACASIIFLVFYFFPVKGSPITPVKTLAYITVISSFIFVISRLFFFRVASVLSVFCIAVYMSYFSSWSLKQRSYDRLLLKDLAAELNPIIKKDDKILIYEIQGQYYLNAKCISMDGIVGDHNIIETLKNKKSFGDFIREQGISYVVTMESMNYRKIFKDTLMEELYIHDIKNPVGSVLLKDKASYTKILSNKFFTSPELTTTLKHANYNYRPEFKVYGPAEEHWHGHVLFWNSVFKVNQL